MRRVLLLGSGCAGKTTLALELGQRLKLPVTHLDSLHWTPGWNAAPKAAFERKLKAALARPAWIIDGSYFSSLAQRLRRADTVVYLDYSRWTCFYRLLKRRIQYRASRGLTRPGMPEGCPERIFGAYAWWLLRYPDLQRPRVLQAVAAQSRSLQFVRLQSPAQAEAWFRSLKAR